MGITVLLVEDHQIVREGLRALLDKQEDIEVVAEAEDGRAAVRLARELCPDVVVLDIVMPGLNGIETARQLIDESRRVKVLALSAHCDKRFVVEILRAGASGYLVKDCAREELVSAIRAVMANQAYLSPRVAGSVIEECVHRPSTVDISASSVLTAREREVVQLLAEGKSTKEAALCLHVSVKTVEVHRHRIMSKLGIRTMAELTKYALREGLTSLEY